MIWGGATLKHLASFRRRLAILAALSLAVDVGMTMILIGTARSASDVVAAAQASHLRTRSFSALQFAADRYQRATYDVLRYGEPMQAELNAAATAFDHARLGVAQLPAASDSAREANARVLALTDELKRMIVQLPTIVRQVDEQWQQNGSTAAMQAIQQRSLPYFQLIDALQREIQINDGALRRATERAERLQIAVIPLAMVALALALFSTIVVFLLIVGRLSPALRRLETGVRQFTEGGGAHRIDMDGHDEFARLAGAFNVMADQIGEQQRHLRNAAADLEIAVEKRTADLEAANAALAAADQRRRVFFAEVSHELRTPITIIHGEAQIALRQTNDDLGTLAESFERILGQARAMSRLINDLFLIARAEADGLDLHLTNVDVGQLAANVASDFQAIASDCGVTIRTGAASGPFVHGDAGRLRQALGAALDNAIRHGGPGTRVDIIVASKGTMVEIRVRDNGPGIDPGMIDTLLQRFRRGATTAEGSGLGLTIIRALVEAHGGTVMLANESTGGLDVIISLPAAAGQHMQGDGNDVGSASG